jgi:recombinational DNA repair ATPase RecF
MPDRSNFIPQSANLWQVKQYLFDYFKQNQDKWLQILDSMPIEVGKFVRAKRTKLFKKQQVIGNGWDKYFLDIDFILR